MLNRVPRGLTGEDPTPLVLRPSAAACLLYSASCFACVSSFKLACAFAARPLPAGLEVAGAVDSAFSFAFPLPLAFTGGVDLVFFLTAFFCNRGRLFGVFLEEAVVVRFRLLDERGGLGGAR